MRETERLTVLTLFFAALFGVKQLFVEEYQIGIDFGLKLYADVFLSFGLFVFLIYALCVGMVYSSSSELKKMGGLANFFYDFGIGIAFGTFSFILLFLGTIWLSAKLIERPILHHGVLWTGFITAIFFLFYFINVSMRKYVVLLKK